MIEIKNLTKIVGNHKVIKNLNLEVNKGEVFGLLGPNGAGKTTIIRMIVGLVRSTSGEIILNKKHITTEFEEAIRDIGAIVETPDLYKYLSGYKNLELFSRMYSKLPKNCIQEAVKLVGLDNRIHDKVKTYSLGMRQRLGIALALLHKPKILILDEPTNGLDPEGIHEMRTYLKKLAIEEGVTIIVSSHLLSEMELMCDRFAILKQGELINIYSMNGKSAQSRYFYNMGNCENISKASVLLRERGLSFDVEGNGVYVNVKREEIPTINEIFFSEGIEVFEIIEQRKTLEEHYLSLVGGNKIR